MASGVRTVLFLIPMLLNATTYTCSVPPGTPLCQFPEKIGIVFIGTALETNYNPNAPAFTPTWFQVAVERPFRGLLPNQKKVLVWASYGSELPEVGKKYFFHAVRGKDNDITLASCGNTRPVEGAVQDIEYLQAVDNGTFRPFVAGSVLRHYDQSQFAVGQKQPPRGLAHAEITLQGPGRVVRARTDNEGRFRIDDVTPGTYTLAPVVPGYSARQTFTASVPVQGCGIAHVGLFTNASIEGVVRRSDGKPAPRVRLDFIDADDAFGPPGVEWKAAETNANGEFRIAGLPGGRFLLGINIEQSSRYPDQTPPTFYPGVAERRDARVIELKPNQAVKGLQLTMLAPRPFRTVRVHLRWPDGKTSPHGAIDAWMSKGIYVSTYKAAVSGVFELQLLQGVDYWLTAAALDRHKDWVYTDNFRLNAGTDAVDVTLTATHPEPQWPKALESPTSNKR